MHLYIANMDFETATQKLNDIMAKYFESGGNPAWKRLETGLWDFDNALQVIAAFEGDDFTVRYRIISYNGEEAFTAPPFKSPISDLEDLNVFYAALGYIGDWMAGLPLSDETHPYYIAQDDRPEFIIKEGLEF